MAGMMTGLLLLLLAGVAVGRVLDLQKRIYGGTECGATERLYHVKLRADNYTVSSLCGGSLISENWILTAGHCVPEGGMTSVRAFLGANRDRETNPVDININDIQRYKEGNGEPHDIALVRLPNPVRDVIPVLLPYCQRPIKKGDEVQIAGHITTSVNNDDDKVSHETARLLCAKTDVAQFTPPTCQYGYHTPYTFCFQRNAVDASQGDSGGGVVFKDRIYGVIVSGNQQACVEARAMDVCKYITWITTVAMIPIPTK